MRYWQMVTVVLVIWLLVIIYMSNNVFPNASDTNLHTERQLQRAMDELQKLRNQNKELHSLVSELKEIKFEEASHNTNEEVAKLQRKLDMLDAELQRLTAQKANMHRKPAVSDAILPMGNKPGPSLQHEVARREVERVSNEFWLYIQSELSKLQTKSQDTDMGKIINTILANGADYQKKLKNDFYTLENLVDGTVDWRRNESLKLGDLVQRRLQYLQNPADCDSARKVLCNLGKGCGYGCQLHHVTYCLITAYATQRTLILDSSGWRYASRGWESVFKPLSDTCTTTKGQEARRWGPNVEDAQMIEMPIVDSLSQRPSFLPLAIPEDLGDRLISIHGDPPAWWIGQMVTYLTRPNTDLKADLEESFQKLGFQNPIVGVHVRRTDKVGMEAQFHALDEYMIHVNEWFNIYEKRQPGVQRRVFLASDDPDVLTEARRTYKNYIFVSDAEASKTAGLNSRYTDASLRGIIHDTHFLSLCDYLVCTFSSQVCRVAYELMQPKHGDASRWFRSLDDIFYYGGQNGHNWVAVDSHVGKVGEMDLQVGDHIGIAGNHWDGYSKGKNSRSGKVGLFPSYKAVDKIVKVIMPTYPEVNEL